MNDREDELQKANERLEQRVRERTSQLTRANELLQAEVKQRRQTEKELENVQRFVEAATQGFGMADVSGKIIYVNPCLARLLGVSAPRDVIGTHVSTYYPAGYENFREQHILPTLQRRETWHGELLMLFPDGKMHPTIHTVSPVWDDNGELSCAAAVITDITELKQAEDALRQSEAKYRALVESSPDAVGMMDLQGRIVFASQRAAEQHGVPDPAALLGMSAVDLVAEEDRDRFRANIHHLLEEGVRRNVEYRGLRKDGTTFAAEVSSAVIPDATGKPLALMGVYRDVSERKQAEAMLRAKSAELFAVAEIQASLLPQESPHVPGFDIAGQCYPAEAAAGDHFDFLQRPDGSLLLVMGDVSGHGIGPAIVAADFCARLRTLSETSYDLSELARKVNAGLFRETGGEIFVTAVLAHLDPQSRILISLNGGHPPAIVLDAAGETKACLTCGGFPFAILPETPYATDDAVELSDGDVVLLYTDGLVEACRRGEPLFGLGRAVQVVRENLHRPAQEIVEALYRAACQYAEAKKPHDDITVVVIKVLANAAEFTADPEQADRCEERSLDVADFPAARTVIESRYYSVEQCDDVTVVRFVDARYFDTDDYTLLHHSLLDFVAHQQLHKLVVDLSNLVYLSTALISTLLMAQKCLQAEKGTMKLSGVSPSAMEALQHLKLVGTLFSIYPDETAAKNAF